MCSTVTAADAAGLRHLCTLTLRICKCLFVQTPRIFFQRSSLSIPILTYLFQTGPHSPYSPHLSSETQLPPGFNNLVGHNLRSYIEDLEKRMRDAAANLEFEEAGRLRDEIRRLENNELGLPDEQKKAPRVGRSNEGKPGTRKTRYGKTRYKRMGGKP